MKWFFGVIVVLVLVTLGVPASDARPQRNSTMIVYDPLPGTTGIRVEWHHYAVASQQRIDVSDSDGMQHYSAPLTIGLNVHAFALPGNVRQDVWITWHTERSIWHELHRSDSGIAHIGARITGAYAEWSVPRTQHRVCVRPGNWPGEWDAETYWEYCMDTVDGRIELPGMASPGTTISVTVYDATNAIVGFDRIVVATDRVLLPLIRG